MIESKRGSNPSKEQFVPDQMHVWNVMIRIAPGSRENNRQVGHGCLFDALCDGVIIVSRSTQPMLESARYFAKRGFSGQLIFWREGRTYPVATGSIEQLSSLTVQEGPNGPRFRKLATKVCRATQEAQTQSLASPPFTTQIGSESSPHTAI